jgi:hypothetical protein
MSGKAGSGRDAMLEGFTEWLTDSPLTALLSDTSQLATWLIIPVSQSLHILCVAVVLISATMLNLRLLGIGNATQNFAKLASQLMPWLWGALIVLLLTGAVQTIAEPGRQLLNVAFRTKMGLLVLVVAVSAIYEQTIKTDPDYWDHSPERRRMGRFLAVVSLLLWVGIASAGRLIAYLDMREF